MIQVKNYFMFSPGGENEGGGTPAKEETPVVPTPTHDEEHKPLGEKVKEALQDWSNKDQADQDFDDTRV